MRHTSKAEMDIILKAIACELSPMQADKSACIRGISVISVPFLISVVTVIYVMTGDGGVVKSPD